MRGNSVRLNGSVGRSRRAGAALSRKSFGVEARPTPTSPKKNVRLNQLQRRNFTLMLAIVSFFLMIGAEGLYAQTGRANISGTVTDSQGAVVSGARVTATNTATGVETSTTTNASGVYSLLQLIPGTYNVKVTKESFGAQQRQNFTLVAEQNAGLDFAIQLGTVSEKITVQGTAELVQTETAELSQTINEHAITELPLNGRNPADLVLLTPGTINVLNVPGGVSQPFVNFPTESAASTNGTRQGGTLYLLDGSYNQDSYLLTASPFPNPDATQEFTVISNNFDPRYGFVPGGVVSIVTKSGTNNWHGDVFDFLRNGSLNAKDFFTHLTNEIHRNQFGGSIGGPLIKNKLFLFGNYQGTRQSLFNATTAGFVWTPAMINSGDFSAYCQSGFTNGLCNDRNPNPNNPNDPLVTHQIWVANPQGYPATGVPLSQVVGKPANTSGVGGVYYPGNIINTATFSPQAVALARVLSTGLTPLNQFGSIEGAGYPTRSPFDEGTVRGDYDINDRNRVSARMFLNYYGQPAFSGGNAVSSNPSWIADYQNYAGTWTWSINSHIVNNATVSYSRFNDVTNSGLIVNGKRICFSQFIQVSDNGGKSPCSIESLTINGGYQSAGIFPGHWQNFAGLNLRSSGFSDNLTISKGKHLIVAGVDVLRHSFSENSDWLAQPLLSFAGGPSGQFTGNGFSDFLLGDLSSLEQSGGESNNVHAWVIAPYVADQIKLTPSLVLSAGLRWEPWISPVPAAGRTSIFDPGHQSTRYPTAPLGMLFPGDRGVSSTGTPSDYTRFFDPRLGLAWSPKALPNTSIRAALGMYATSIDYSSFNHVSDTAPFSPTYNFATGNVVNGSPIPIIPFANPYSVFAPTNFTSPFPPFSTSNSSPGPNQATFVTPVFIQSAFDRHFTDGRTYTWNMSVEHRFGSNWVATAAYVGSESDHQSYLNDANLGLPVCGPVSSTCAPVTSNPRVNPLFTQVLLYYSGANASYESGQFSLERRFAHGLQFAANYTYSHTIDVADAASSAFFNALDNPGCIRCNRGNSFLDTPNVFVANFIYETPEPMGWNRGARLAVGGWQISGIYRAQSGQPFSVYCGCATSWQDDGLDYPDFAPGVTHVTVHPGDLNHYVVASNFVNAPQGRDGNIGRNPSGVFGPGINTWDLGLSKSFRFTERYHFQFRWEMFNAFNRVTFANPQNFTSSSTFGLISSTNPAYPSRVMQLAAKLYF
jgi:Carboxypeptidase regulatory-like domain